MFCNYPTGFQAIAGLRTTGFCNLRAHSTSLPTSFQETFRENRTVPCLGLSIHRWMLTTLTYSGVPKGQPIPVERVNSKDPGHQGPRGFPPSSPGIQERFSSSISAFSGILSLGGKVGSLALGIGLGSEYLGQEETGKR